MKKMNRVKEGDKRMWMISKWILAGIFTICFLGVPPVLAQELVPAMHYFILELDGGVTANLGTPEVSILRAQCRERAGGIELDVSGAAHDPADAVVTISDTNAGTVFGTATAVPDLANPVIGVYAFQLSNNPAFTVCPTSVTASIQGATAVAAVDVTIDAAPPVPVAGPIELEGPISAVVDNGNGTGSITVMGITVAIPAAVPINSPTAALTLAQLADPAPLPGRSSPGFIGGTAIIIGHMDGVTPTADDVFTEPAENVVVGPITQANCTNADCSNPGDSLRVLGTPLSRLTDPRIPAKPPTNAFGFQIDMSQGVLVGGLASVEGYFGQIGTVPPPNSAPTITSTPVLTATVDVLYTYDVNATDPDVGDTITFSLVTAPVGMTIDPVTGVINWTPTAGQVGPNGVTVRATDSGALFGDQIFTVTVGAVPVNTAPTITSTPVTTGAVGQLYTYDVNATDPDVGDTITFSLTTAPAGMTINATTGVISWTPTAGQLGPNGVTVRATDSGALFAEQSFTVTVTQPAQPDTITVTKAEFKQIGSEWRIEGTSLPVPVGPRTISVFLGPTVAGGTLIGTTNVAADGKWTFLQLNSPVRPPSTLNQRISVQSSSGGKLENVTLLIRR